MKKVKLLLPILLLVAIQFAQAQNREAVKYNNQIINRQHKITKGFLKLFKSFEKGTKEQMESKRSKLLTTLNESITNTKAMGDFEGDADLRNGAIEVFSFYKGSLEMEYPHMIELIANRDRSDSDHRKLDDYAAKLIEKEEEIDEKFEDIQIAYAKRHGLSFIAR